MPGDPKRHHFVPQSYLSAWANEFGQVAIRRRGSNATPTPHIRNVAIEGGLYGQGESAREVEQAYSQIETQWPVLADLLIRQRELSNEQRDLVSLFVALQITRTPDQIRQIEFIENVVRFAGSDSPTSYQVARYLEQVHLGFPPGANEVEAAWAFVTGAKAMDSTSVTRTDTISILFATAIRELSPRIAARSWRVRHCRKRILVTTDRPVTNWTRRSRADAIGGTGLANAFEVRLPLGPQHLLVIDNRETASLTYEEVKPRTFYEVNSEAVARCATVVMASPHRSNYLGSLQMTDRGPTLRFRVGPGYQQLPDGSKRRMNDVIHMYTPRY